jgi:hypothetical protein
MAEVEPAGVSLKEGAAELAVDRNALASLAAGETLPSPWTVEAGPDWQRHQMLRLISAAFEDGTLLAIAALRPVDAEGHDREAVGGLLTDPEGALAVLPEALISTEFGPDGRPRRLGLELYKDPDSPPLRVAGEIDPTGARTEASGAWTQDTAQVGLRWDERRGHGLYEVLTSP